MKPQMPPISKSVYNHSLAGHYGEFGTGANVQIYFMQSALEPAALNKIALIGDIHGSERWSVRDLFQREVDDQRVTEGILPYLKDQAKVKFFNPLTLTMLPID